MQYCRKCRQLVPAPEHPACSTCGAPLVGLDQLPDDELDRPVVLTWCKDIIEAEMLRAALGGLDIYAVVENEALVATFNSDPTAQTRVLVRLRDAGTAFEALKAKQAGELAITEDDLPDGNAGPDEPGNP